MNQMGRNEDVDEIFYRLWILDENKKDFRIP
jgi:hypothetical protein